MSCCVRFTNALTGKRKVDATSRALSLESSNDVVSWYKCRPAQTGKWFVAHKTVAEQIMNEIDATFEPINIWHNFFSRHPIGEKYCENFVAITLNDEEIKKYHDRIRLASYRWEDIKGVGKDGAEYHAPSNYIWFLKFLEKEKVLGWMDFMANIVVNCSGGETVAYMGSLYAQYRTVSHWMIDPTKLEAAMKRGWIYQETAFGAFDCNAISSILDEMRGLALSSLSSNKDRKSKQARIESCLKFVCIAEHLSHLLDRRGYYAMAQITPLLCDRQYDYYDSIDEYGMISNVSKLVVDRVLENCTFDDFYSRVEHHVNNGYEKGYTAMFHICDLFTDQNTKRFDAAYQAIKTLLTTKSWSHASTVDQIFEKIGDPLLAAFSGLEVTYETDRDNAVTQVAKAILADDFQTVMTHEEFCKAVWVGAADICLQTRGTIGTSILRFQPTIAQGNRFIGGVTIGGARLDGNGGYNTKHGSKQLKCSWAVSCISCYSIKFTWDENTNSWWIDEKNGDNGKRYDVFLCKPPIGNFFCGYVARQQDTGLPVYAQFFTDQSPPEFAEPAIEATFT